MPIFAGIDVGVQSVKAVLFDGDKVLGARCVVTEEEADKAARSLYEGLLSETGIDPGGVERVFATGWGAADVSFVDGVSSEQICGAKGARFLFPSARTVIDLGSEGCRVMKLDEDGALVDFANNSKCASGTGAFIELGAVYLKVSLEELGRLSLAADGVAEVSSTCAVFAESVIISNIHNGEPIEWIAAGINKAAATRVSELVGRLGLVEDVVLIGGAALNPGLVRVLEDQNGIVLKFPEEPRTVTALGAAIHAGRKRKRRRKEAVQT